MIYTKASPVAKFDAYRKIRLARPAWFKAAADLDVEDFEGFGWWINANATAWYELDWSIVFVFEEGHEARLNPCILGKVVLDDYRAIIQRIEDGGVVRIECPVMNEKGRSMRIILRGLGFQLEGTLYSKEKTIDALTGHITYHDVEMWAKVKGRS